MQPEDGEAVAFPVELIARFYGRLEAYEVAFWVRPGKPGVALQQGEYVGEKLCVIGDDAEVPFRG